MSTNEPRVALELKLQELHEANSRLQALNRQLEESNRRLYQANEPLVSTNEKLQTVLDELLIGVVITSAEGRPTFLNQRARQFLDPGQSETSKTWEDMFPIDKQDKELLRIVCKLPAAQRSRIPVHWRANGELHCAEIEIRDGTHDPSDRIFFLHNLTRASSTATEGCKFQDVCEQRKSMPLVCREVKGFCGQSRAMQRVCHEIQDLATVDTTVLVEGETGTGKEVVARAIHYSGIRQRKPFLAINCSGLTESLLTSQLFGHKRGSFTGAVADQVGFFEAAEGGTLFLDEIGDMPLSLQSSLLRVLQEREITRIGETRPRKIDVRIIAATHRDLNAAAADETFRQDLFYRLRVARIVLSPLREHPEDIPLLVAQFCRDLSKFPVMDIRPEALDLLMKYSWPGNVRELKSVIESAVIHLKQPALHESDLPREIREIPPAARKGGRTDERRVLEVLGQVYGNRTEAARVLGISRATLYRILAGMKTDTPE